MRKKKTYQGATRRIFRPELTHCLECGRRLRRAAPVSQRHVVTFAEVVQVIHCAYRCPQPDCPGHTQLYRSAQADGLALPGFTFGLDILLWVGKLRLADHQTVDAHPSKPE